MPLPPMARDWRRFHAIGGRGITIGRRAARNPDLRRAGLAGLGGLAGFVLGVVARSVFGVVIVGLAVLAYIF